MRRAGIALFVTTLTLLTLSASVLAGPAFGVGGNLNVEVRADQTGVAAKSTLNTEITSDFGPNLTGLVQFDPFNAEWDLSGRPTYSQRVGITTAYLEYTRTDLAVRAGTVDGDFSSFIFQTSAADQGDNPRVGVLATAELGSMTANVYVADDHQNAPAKQARGVRLSFSPLSALSVATTVGQAVTQNGTETAYAVHTAVKPSEALSAALDYAAQGSQNVYVLTWAQKVGSQTDVEASYRDFRATATGFDPYYRDRSTSDSGDPEDSNLLTKYAGDRGFAAGVRTSVEGISFNASYDDPDQTTEFGASTSYSGTDIGLGATMVRGGTNTTTLSLGRKLMVSGKEVKGKYALTVSGGTRKHEISAKTEIDLSPATKGVELDGKLTFDGADRKLEGSAAYTTPSKWGFTLEYDSSETAKLWLTVKKTYNF